MSISAPPLGPGAKVDGEYLVRETIGKGKGGGAVYKARRCSRPAEPPVALKFPAGSTEVEAMEAVKETRGVPRLLAAGQHMGHRFAVTQVLGMPLSEVFRRIEPMSVDDKWNCVKIFGRLLVRRLEAVHRCGWVHGDVAPDNVLFGRTDDGAVSLYLIDFGCARRFPGGEAVKAFWNTVEFASVRAVQDTVREPYDDLESLGYVLCHGIFGDLPWFRWTRGRNNWEETRGKDCERVRSVKLTFLRGEWCSLGFEWIHLMKMPPDLSKFLVRCLYRPKADDGLPDYNTLAELLQERPGEQELSEAIDIAFLTEKCQDMAPEWHPPPPLPPPAPEPGNGAPESSPASNGHTDSAVHYVGPPATDDAAPSPSSEWKGGSSPTTDIAPEQTRSSLFDFDELDDEAMLTEPEPAEPELAACMPASAPTAVEAPVEAMRAEPIQAEAEALPCPPAPAPVPVAAKLERTASPRSPRSPRTPRSWFDFDKLEDMDMIEA